MKKRIFAVFLIAFFIFSIVSVNAELQKALTFNDLWNKLIFVFTGKATAVQDDILYCTPGTLKSGTECLVCNKEGTIYNPDNSYCKLDQHCSAEGKCLANNYNLYIYKSGLGTVKSNDGKIYCGDSCTGSYSSNTQVSLTASPALGYVFDGWQGCESNVVTAYATAADTCTVTMNSDKKVYALFNAVKTETTPNFPTNLRTTIISTSQIKLAWQDNSNNEQGFKIERRVMPALITAEAIESSSYFRYSNCEGITQLNCDIEPTKS